jgi:two-component system, NtrC family, sensor histidine kinase HydH
MALRKHSFLYILWTRYKIIPLYWKVLSILAVLGLIFSLDQQWLANPIPREILHRLYFLPIILSGLLFGFKGGVGSAVVVTLLFIPHWIPEIGPLNGHRGRVDEIILFFAFGILIGLLVDRERLETQLREDQEHMAIMGEAAATVAHELKNPIITIGAYVKRIQQKIDPEDPNRERLNLIFHECQRVEILLKDMIHFSRPIDLELALIDINRLVKEILEVMRPQAEQCQIALSARLEGELPLVHADEARLTQVFYNLILNGIQASPPDQPVLVETRKMKGQVLVEVSDGGCGIPSEVRDKIFHPFYSTKKQGTGMGLPISKRIVELHKGRLFCRANEPCGTVFSIILPVSRKSSLKLPGLGGRTKIGDG